MHCIAAWVAGLALVLGPVEALSQPSPVIELSLADAIARARSESEEVRLAESAVAAAETRITAARAAALPSIDATTAYSRTFQSPFTSGLDFAIPDDQQFNPDPNASLEARVRYLEQNADKAVLTTISDLVTGSLQRVGLGSPHTYNLNLGGTQVLYSGGRIGAAVQMATHAREAAQLTTREQEAQVELDVRTAYFQALLAQELEGSAEAALVQAESFANQVRLRLKAGFAADLDVLRAEVAQENLRPQLVQATNALQIALLNLKRLVNLPMEQPVRLTTRLDVPTAPMEEDREIDVEAAMRQRASVLAAEQQIAVREQGVRAARAQYFPSVALQAGYGAQAFPQGLFDVGNMLWRPNGSASLAVQIPLFAGFQRRADVGNAEVQLRQAQLQAAQLREAVRLEYQRARGERERARATIAARQRTVEQAQRVYDLTVLRYEQGQATLLEISDARLALLQSRTNLAQALADFYIATANVRRAVGIAPAP
jgi:outer membrane protein TolC